MKWGRLKEWWELQNRKWFLFSWKRSKVWLLLLYIAVCNSIAIMLSHSLHYTTHTYTPHMQDSTYCTKGNGMCKCWSPVDKSTLMAYVLLSVCVLYEHVNLHLKVRLSKTIWFQGTSWCKYESLTAVQTITEKLNSSLMNHCVIPPLTHINHSKLPLF